MGRKSNAQKEAERLMQQEAERVASQQEPPTPATASADLRETTEFKQAVREAVSDAIPAITRKIISELKEARGGVEVDSAEEKTWAAGLAMAIAQLTDQGTGRKRVSPEIVRQRAEARTRMMELIVEARAHNEVPVYTLRNKTYLQEQMIEPIYIDPASKQQRATEIEWRSVPNQVMKPANDVADRIYAAYTESIGSVEADPYQKPIQGVTAGGLVIRSGSAAVRQPTVLREDDPGNAPTPENGLSVRHKDRPGQYVERRVLGTVAPPARQTA